MEERQQWFDHKFNLGIGIGWTKNVLSRIENTEILLRYYLKDVSEERLTKKEGEKYSIKEHIGHLIDLEDLWINRFLQFEQEVPVLVSTDLENTQTKLANHNEQSLDNLWSNFGKEREKLINTFNQLSPKAQNHMALHPRLEVEMQPVDLLFFVAEHDEHHLTSIKEIINHSLIQ